MKIRSHLIHLKIGCQIEHFEKFLSYFLNCIWVQYMVMKIEQLYSLLNYILMMANQTTNSHNKIVKVLINNNQHLNTYSTCIIDF